MIASVPVDLGRDEAAQLAREELAKQVYRDAGPGQVERLVRWLLEQAGRLLDGAAGVSPAGYSGLVVVLLLVAAAVVAVRLKVGPLGRRAAREEALFVGRTRTAAQHRAAADAHAAVGAWAEAVRERLRAVVRSLEERAVLDERAGRTADEAAADAGRALPSCAVGLRAAAVLFDEIWYGGRPAGPESYAALRDLDAQVQAARPDLVGQR
ncbi:MAG TPA: DUF4129 domain-containing protein [Mycobacteriales bacterium]|nr:DUF4129 domain-containing protein [Mycobacteriales bacterium]